MTEKRMPYVNPKVRRVGFSKLRTLTGKTAKTFNEAWLLYCDDEPKVIVLPYDWYMKVQQRGIENA